MFVYSPLTSPKNAPGATNIRLLCTDIAIPFKEIFKRFPAQLR